MNWRVLEVGMLILLSFFFFFFFFFFFIFFIFFIFLHFLYFLFSSSYLRGDPFTGKRAPTTENWPRNGAVLRGWGPYSAKGENWMRVKDVKQKGEADFKTVPEGTWMMYEQSGPLLRDCDGASC